MALTFKAAKLICNDLGIALAKKRDGDYRVNYVGHDERSAYYTPDLTDAVDTAKVMAAGANSTRKPRAYGIKQEGDAKSDVDRINDAADAIKSMTPTSSVLAEPWDDFGKYKPDPRGQR